jgi:nucleoside-diphosphate-sugar epimerase
MNINQTDMKRASISILGCGWLGLPLALDLQSKGYRVKASTTTESKLPQISGLGIDAYLVNIELTESLSGAFFDSDILIINITSKNVGAYQGLIDQLQLKDISHLIFISSTSVYDNNLHPVTEETPTNGSPLSQIEKLLLDNGHLKTTIVRFGGLFGYDRQPGRFFRNGRTIEEPDAVVNYIHRDDCIQLIEKIIAKQLWGEVFNGVTDTHPTKREFYTYMAHQVGADKPVFGNQISNATKWVSNQKVKKMLGLQFFHSDLLQYKPE